MKIRNFIIFSVILVIALFISFYFIAGKERIGQLIDKIGLTKNVYDINIDEELIWDTSIFWYGENGFARNKDDFNKMLIFNRSLISDIPANYGKNKLRICYKNTCYDNMGIWKMYAYSKHKYSINMQKMDSLLIIDWEIKNWYDPDILQGRDTLQIK